MQICQLVERNLWNRSVGEESVLIRTRNLMCLERNMSAMERSGKGRRRRIGQQLSEECMQGLMNEESEPAFE